MGKVGFFNKIHNIRKSGSILHENRCVIRPLWAADESRGMA